MTDLARTIEELQKRLTDYNADTRIEEFRHAEALAEAAQEVLDAAAAYRAAATKAGRFAAAVAELEDAVNRRVTNPDDGRAAMELLGAASAVTMVVAWMVQAEAAQTLLPYGIFLPHRLLDEMLGERITDEEMGRLTKAIPHSSIPAALQEILAGLRTPEPTSLSPVIPREAGR